MFKHLIRSFCSIGKPLRQPNHHEWMTPGLVKDVSNNYLYFNNRDAFAAFFQVRHDLTQRYNKSQAEAHSILSNWTPMGDAPKADEARAMMLREEPFYWATRLALQSKDPDWVKKCGTLPRDYTYCYEHHLLKTKQAPYVYFDTFCFIFYFLFFIG